MHAKNRVINKLCLGVVKDRTKVKSPDDPLIKALEETDDTNDE